MRTTAQIDDMRRVKLLGISGRFEKKELTGDNAAELPGISRSTFYRMRIRYSDAGDDGLIDHQVGKPSPRRIPVDTRMTIANVYRSRYLGWTIKHFH